MTIKVTSVHITSSKLLLMYVRWVLLGVDEPLNETAGGMSHYPSWERFGDGIVVRGKHLVLLSNIQDAMRELRTMMDEQYLPFFSFYSPAQAFVPSDIVKMPSKAMLRASPLGVELPINIHLVTLEAIAESKLLVRLGHQFAVGEAGALSAEVTMDLRKVLSPFSPQSCAEYTLSANELYEERQQRKVQWDTGAGLDSKRGQKATGGNDPCVVTIAAMQIKTYIIQY
jgi:lysosomal alpha-mannosidase